MADKTIPDLTTTALQTGYFTPFAINAATEAGKTTIDGLARFIYENYISSQPAPYYTDSLSVNYGGYGVFGNLYASGKFHSRGTGYFDSIIGGSIASITVGNPTSHVVAGTSSIIQNAPFSAIIGGVGSLIKTNANGGIFVGGGLNNTAEADASYAAMLGGESNSISGSYSVAIGGRLNETNNQYCGTFGGLQNVVSNLYGAIIGGNNNEITNASESSSNSAIIGANLSAISGSISSAICGGGEQKIAEPSEYSFVGGGYGNIARGVYNSILSAESCSTSGVLASVIGSSNSHVSGAATSRSIILGGSSHVIAGALSSAIIAGDTSKVSGNYAVVLGARNAQISSSQAGATILGDSNTTNVKYAKAANSLSLHYAGGVVVSGSSLEVERTGAFYGGVAMGTGRVVLTATSGTSSISTLAIAPGAYSGFAVSAPGVRTGDFVTISQTSYSGSTFGDAANTLLTFNPQAFHNEIRFYMFNPAGPSSIAPNARLDWLVFKTSPLGTI